MSFTKLLPLLLLLLSSTIIKGDVESEEDYLEDVDDIEELENLIQERARGSENRPRDCSEIDGGDAEGVHQIYPNGRCPVSARCNNTEGGGWTVIQNRFDGYVDFYRKWEEYAVGFGDPAGEYWLGLRHINELTQAEPMELYVALTDFEKGPLHAKYDTFSVASEKKKFKLKIGGYSGNAGDALKMHNRQKFSTKDQDNDKFYFACAESKHGAWWYKSCYRSNLNGRYTPKYRLGSEYMNWDGFVAAGRPVKTSTMMIRPANFKPKN